MADDQLDEFMKIMQPRNKKGPLWANDAPSVQPAVPAPENDADADADAPGDDKAAHDEAISDLEWMKRRMGSAVDEVDKVFEQSDDEDAPPKPSTNNA
ncbi:hypothetical protein C0993_004795, partial [Termitomyces sp. T159_Od127]